MALFRRLRDVIYAVFFLAHLATIVLFDAQLLFSRSIIPWQPAVIDMLDQYAKDFKDPIVGNLPVLPWVKSLLYFEVATMAPFLLIGFFGALLGARWMRIPSVMYGTAVFTTCLPMIAHILYGDFTGLKVAPQTQEERCIVASVYTVYAAAGLIIALDYALFRSSGPTSRHQQDLYSQKKRN